MQGLGPGGVEEDERYKLQTLFLDGASHSIACSRAMKTSGIVIPSTASSVQPYLSRKMKPKDALNNSKAVVSGLVTLYRLDTLSTFAIVSVLLLPNWFLCNNSSIECGCLSFTPSNIASTINA